MDPVSLVTGSCFERASITAWFAEGNTIDMRTKLISKWGVEKGYFWVEFLFQFRILNLEEEVRLKIQIQNSKLSSSSFRSRYPLSFNSLIK